MEELYIIVGLGNPGNKYESTRHNVGFQTIDLLAQKYKINVNKIKFKGILGDGIMGEKRVILLKPQTFMNLSGESLREVVSFYRIPMKNVMVVYDDIDLPVGKIRIRASGSAGSHNGMKSLIYQLVSEDFPRVRIGIGKPPENWDLANYVLSRFSEEEQKLVIESVDTASHAVKVWLDFGIEASMNRFNKK